MILWRISNHATLDGRGGLLTSARWHSLGRPIVYLAETPAGALLEVLVHLELDLESLPPNDILLKTEAPQDLKMNQISLADLPRHWRSDQAITREIGDKWLASRETVLMRVPSVIVPETFNVVLNPEHADAQQIKVISRQSYPWDQRLVRRR